MSGMPKWMWPLVAALYPMIAHATFHTWTIETIYPSADGTVQFVVLHESQGFAVAGLGVIGTPDARAQLERIAGDRQDRLAGAAREALKATK